MVFPEAYGASKCHHFSTLNVMCKSSHHLCVICNDFSRCDGNKPKEEPWAAYPPCRDLHGPLTQCWEAWGAQVSKKHTHTHTHLTKAFFFGFLWFLLFARHKILRTSVNKC